MVDRRKWEVSVANVTSDKSERDEVSTIGIGRWAALEMFPHRPLSTNFTRVPTHAKSSNSIIPRQRTAMGNGFNRC